MTRQQRWGELIFNDNIQSFEREWINGRLVIDGFTLEPLTDVCDEDKDMSLSKDFDEFLSEYSIDN